MIRPRVRINGLADEVRRRAAEAEHDSVTPYWVARIVPYLDSEERLTHLLTMSGSWGVRIEGSDESTRKGGGLGPFSSMNNTKKNVLAVTTDRVLVIASELSGQDAHSILFDTINGVDTETTGRTKKIVI